MTKVSWADIRNSCVLLEDKAILVLNKPTGISVIGDSSEADLVILAQNAGEQLLPVHRIDKETSGAIIFAKDPLIHAELTRQFAKRTVDKTYLAIIKSGTLPQKGTIDLPLSIGRKKKVRVASQRSDIAIDSEKNVWSVAQSHVFQNTRIYPSITTFAKAWEDEQYTLLIVKPITGRRHQIRVHLAWIGYPIIGDPLFQTNNLPSNTRTFLHSWRISFTSTWADGNRITIGAPPQDDFWEMLKPNLSTEELIENAYDAVEQLGLENVNK